ncbi:hypothetical protein BT246_70010 (plasmid) [Bacillus thuringiensis]|uniref:Uncharacterized protein n=1 Tax=Bacillus thuringiensis TaxID=1428 RepID=A0A9W3X4F4_BACTU|nr:hypothetical protein BT246_70010 [Bacillus thuringiensis]
MYESSVEKLEQIINQLGNFKEKKLRNRLIQKIIVLRRN